MILPSSRRSFSNSGCIERKEGGSDWVQAVVTGCVSVETTRVDVVIACLLFAWYL